MTDTLYMAWFDGSSMSIELKIERGAKVFELKFKKRPNLVQVHPSVIPTERIINGIKVEPHQGILPFDIWFTRVEADQKSLPM